jgi:hypothetical protein
VTKTPYKKGYGHRALADVEEGAEGEHRELLLHLLGGVSIMSSILRLGGHAILFRHTSLRPNLHIESRATWEIASLT